MMATIGPERQVYFFTVAHAAVVGSGCQRAPHGRCLPSSERAPHRLARVLGLSQRLVRARTASTSRVKARATTQISYERRSRTRARRSSTADHGTRYGRAMSGSRVHLSLDGPIATITNDNPDKHNAFDDEMDVAAVRDPRRAARRPEVRAVIWRGEGKSFSSGRDVGSIGTMQGRAVAPRADAPRPPRHPAAVGARRAGDRRVQGLGDGRLVPAGAALRHPGRGRGHALPAARGDLRRDPRHRRRRGAVRDVRATGW